MIAHVWSRFDPKSPEAKRRHGLAQETWRALPWNDQGIRDDTLPRTFQEGQRRFPYVRDLFDRGCHELEDQDIVVFTNADIGMVPQSCLLIAMALQDNDAGYAFRRDFHHRMTRLPTFDEVQTANFYCGKDVYFFRAAWWRAYRRHFPDMIIGREAWDAVMVELVEATNRHKPLTVDNLCWHERHGNDGNGAYWEDPTNRYTLPGQRHNLTLAKEWMKRNGINPAKHGIR